MTEDVTVERCVELAMRIEEAGAELYQRLAGKFAQDPVLSELYAGLGRDEAQHREQFRALRERAASISRQRALTEEQRNYLRAMSMDDALASTGHLEREVEAIRTRDDALERTLALEKGTLSFYQALREVLGNDEVLDTLVAVERSHVVKVMELLLTGAKFRGLADRF